MADGGEEGPFKPKNKHPGFLKNLTEYGVEYTENSSLHGVRYLGERKRNIFERIWWMVVFAISLYLCVDLIIKTYDKWNNSPVIVSFAQSPTPVWSIPFPAITVCPEIKSRQRSFNFTYYYHKLRESENMTQEELNNFENIALICENHIYNKGNDTVGIEAIEFIGKVAPQFDEVLWSCKWTGNNQTCDTLFTPILTEEGVCYTFNMLDRDDIYSDEVVYYNDKYLNHNPDNQGWTLEKGYTDYASKDTFPRRAMSAGADAGLIMLMRGFEQDLDYICKGPVQGFKILLHHPGEVPRVASQYFRAPFNQEMIVGIKPDMMTTSEGLRGYDPHRRQCYFSDERFLRFYKTYTQENCEVECLTNYTLQECGCVAYHMPHAEGTPICGTGKIVCMFKAKGNLLSQQVKSGLESSQKSEDDAGDDDAGEDSKTRNAKDEIKCDCLPACTSLQYNAETSQADFNWPALFQAFKANLSEFPGIKMTRMTFFFKDMQFITSERNELYGLTDFMASCGGLLGLFMGFSFLSGVELIYFLTMRLSCNVRRYGRHFWSASNVLLENDAYEHSHQK